MSKVARIAFAVLSVGLCAVAGFAADDAPQNFAADVHLPGAVAPNVATAPRDAGAPAPALYAVPEAILYDNGPLVTHPGGGFGGGDASALQGALAMTTLGFGHQIVNNNRMADDFTVPAGGWNVSQITFFAYQTNSTTTSTMTDVRLQIWDGPPGVGGSAVVFGDLVTNRLASTSFTNIWRVTDTTLTANNRPIMANVVTVGAILAPGTYWLDWFAGGTLASGPWAPPVTILSQTTTGNGMQSLAGGAFAPALDGGTFTQQGFPFIIEGAVGPAITLSKTVGLTAGVCGVDETLVVPSGTPVTYCYTVTNTGTVTLNFHTLVDDQLGTLLNNFPLPLAPGNSAFITVDDVVLAGTTTNNATWTAYESVTSSSSTTCSTPALAIPDSTPAGVDDILVMATSGTLTDLDVSLDLTHTWVGDVTVSISNGTTTASFFDRPGYTGSGFGCSGDNADVIANDEGVDPGIEGQCTNAPAVFGDAPGGDPTSTTLFAAFDGQPLAGTWTLHASDSVGGDTGTINEWCLIASYEEGVGGDADSDSVTVTVLPPTAPDIAVSPGSLSSFQAVDTTTDHMLDITNNGDANLDWTITEDAGLIGHYVVAQVPGRQQPILPHRRSTPPEANEITTGDQTLSRSTTSVAGGTTTPVRGEAPDGTTTITHSASQAITALNSVSCNSGGFHADNSYLRSFTLTDFGITGGFGVTQVEVGIEQATGTGGTQPATVNLYTWDPVDPFTFANFVPIGTVNTLVPDQAATIITVPVTGSAPAGSTLVVEFFTPSGQPAVAQLFAGSNAAGQTAPTYIASAACGLPEPTDTAAIGFPNMHLVMNVTGSTGCDVDLTWASVSSAAGTTVPSTTDQVTVTLDSTGLIQGAIYTGGLCIQSNDPDTPLVLVPLTLEVDGMDFSDGFETGDTSRWSVVAP